MFKVTQKEEIAVMRIQGIYTSLQIATDKLARSLLFEPVISSTAQKPILGFGSGRRQKEAAQKEKHKLLEVLTILRAEIEACLPTTVRGRLYFKCRLVDENEFDTDRFCTSEAKSANDMIACFEELERRMSKVMAYPEIAEVVQKPYSYELFPSLARPNLGISQIAQAYLDALEAEKSTNSGACGVLNPNTSRRKKIRRSKVKKSGKKCQQTLSRNGTPIGVPLLLGHNCFCY